MENQEEIWDSIAFGWETYRIKPIDEVIEFLKGKRGKILDLGCGGGKHFPYINGEIYGIDFSKEMLNYAQERADKNNLKVNLTKTTADSLPFENNFFDSVIFIAALHCITTKEKREKTLKELFRVLKSGAETLITVWDHNQERFKNLDKEATIPWKHDGKEYKRYYYLYDKEEFVNLLKKIGFKIVKISDKESPNGFYSQKNINVIVKKP